jgi:A/G-specific adenine glycosylase
VLAWGVPRLRDLPWRDTRDPWAILVAEVMLQQTQAGRVIPKWEAFLDDFPTPHACSAASLGDVLRGWQGLGYPRRARNLHRTGALVVERHGGALPDALDELLALPGIGSYTARAVLAFAFERDVAVVDTNVARVLARTSGQRLTPRRAQGLADSVVPVGEGWAWNQTMIDLGAAHCRPAPDCDGCPLAPGCTWHLAAHVEPDPADGSAHVSTTQPRWEGSDRQARGRILAALSAGTTVELPRDDRIAAGLIADGLVVVGPNGLELPN